MRLNATRLGSIASSRSFGDQLDDLAGQVPNLDLNFARNKSLIDDYSGTTLVTFTRASSGTYVGSDGLIKSATTNEPRFDHNPTTGESLGLLVEEARTNVLLNSATLSTQSVTVAAAANTLSFYGTGTVTLTGVSTAGPLVGTGANNRVSLTFTPTVGVLILTVSGSVTNAQLEAGAFATSYIPTTTATVTRAADVASITGSNFSSWYNQTEGTVFTEYAGRQGGRVFMADDGTTNNRFEVRVISATSQLGSWSAGTQDIAGLFAPTATGLVDGVLVKTAVGLKVNDAAISTNGAAVGTDTSCAMPVALNRMILGSFQGSATFLNGPIKRLTFWPTRFGNEVLQRISQP